MKEIWFAGGCFWGTEKLFRSIKGVVATEVGYANGSPDIIPDYEAVCRRQTGYRETVHVTYDPESVSLEYLIYSFYLSIDPTLKNRQGNDYGPQYQACIFWNDEKTKSTVLRISATESRRCTEFNVVLEALTAFFPAEEYHQKYLDKNEHGYCHIEPYLFNMVSNRKFDPAAYCRPPDALLLNELSEREFYITQNGGTEYPFDNEYHDNFRKGIYVDRITGEPLFRSDDKYDSHCGWPSFSRPIDMASIRYLDDYRFDMHRIEVRSRVGNTHLGHVFYGETDSPTGARFCINSASLRFIPESEMMEQGYGFLLDMFRN